MAKKRKSKSLNKPALITGASAGIGAEFARQLASRGHDLVLVARDRERLLELARSLSQEHGNSVEVLAADLVDPAGLAEVERFIAGAGPLAVLVNNAGFGFGTRFVEAGADEHERMIRLHVVVPVRLSRAALPAMLEAGRGSIVNVSSISAFGPGPGRVTYAATKGYLNTFSSGLALELAGTGVEVQALCPGLTRSEFHQRANMKPKAPKLLWMNADQVVAASLKALGRGSVVVIPGLHNKVLAAAGRTMPRAMVKQAILRVGALKRG